MRYPTCSLRSGETQYGRSRRTLDDPQCNPGAYTCVEHPGTPNPVFDVLEYLAGGMTEQEILRDFPDPTAEDIRACLAFAADRERRLVTYPAA